MEISYPDIKSYNFDGVLRKQYNSFIWREDVKDFELKNPQIDFNTIAKEYWSNPAISGEKLAIKYSIPNSISFFDILKAYPTKQYGEYLKYYYNSNNSLDDICKKYLLNEDEAMSLAMQIELSTIEEYCCYCIDSNDFFIKRVLTDGVFEYKMFCDVCKIEAKVFLSKIEALNELEIHGCSPYLVLENEISNVNSMLSGLNCPHCNSKLSLIQHTHRLGYEINCANCKARWGSYTKLRLEVCKKEILT